ncbi:MAG: hypothetical protein HZB86_00255 [Deltaproteobacteria bacterium]|nr:hypothetical protein [Deltaproteobacteria bacterium]
MTVRRLVVFSVFWLGLVLAVPRTPEAHPNARFLRGDITVSTSWEGVIRLTGTVVIREGVTVTVDPGTEILVQPGEGTDIEVRGRLLVRGIPEKPVLFDTAGGCAAGSWGGIRFRPGSTGTFENVRIRCSAAGVAGETSGVTKKGVTLEAGR